MGVTLAVAILSLFVLRAETTVTNPRTVVHFYKINKSCPAVENFVRFVVQKWYFKDQSITAALLRLQYSDCFVGGCDASILLDSYNGSKPEKKAPQNLGLRGFELIDEIKAVLENKCPGVVSCADIIALATRDAIALAGGPAYPVPTGRRDGLVSKTKEVNLPGPNITLQGAIALFKKKGLDVSDLITLLGAHNVGSAHCSYILDRIYNFKGSRKADPSMDPAFVGTLKKKCPLESSATILYHDPTVFMTPDSGKSYVFDNSYYKQILKHRALFEIDQALDSTADTSKIVSAYANDFESYRFAIADSMGRMGDIGVLTAGKGEIRQNCRIINKNNPKFRKS